MNLSRFGQPRKKPTQNEINAVPRCKITLIMIIQKRGGIFHALREAGKINIPKSGYSFPFYKILRHEIQV